MISFYNSKPCTIYFLNRKLINQLKRFQSINRLCRAVLKFILARNTTLQRHRLFSHLLKSRTSCAHVLKYPNLPTRARIGGSPPPPKKKRSKPRQNTRTTFTLAFLSIFTHGGQHLSGESEQLNPFNV